MKLVEDWRNWWRWHSTHTKLMGVVLTSAAGAAALSSAATSWISVVDLGVVLLIAAGLFVASFVGRLIHQGAWRKLLSMDGGSAKPDDSDEAGA